MTITDFLTFVGIAVSVIFGFFVSHYCSVKDARTRVIKDYYIEQLKQIKGRVDTFYHRVAFGKLSARKIITWYDHIQLDIKSLDEGIRKTLDTQIDEFSDELDKYYAEITNWDDFNDHFSDSQYVPNIKSRERLLQIKYEIDEFLNDYILHVNQANNFSIFKIQWRRIKQSRIYFLKKGKKVPLLSAIGERFQKHILEIGFSIATIIGIIYLFLNIEKEKKSELVEPLQEISAKQDSICKSIQSFEKKYEPVIVNTKTFNNSAFFNADKVDSVHIKLYQDKKYRETK